MNWWLGFGIVHVDEVSKNVIIGDETEIVK